MLVARAIEPLGLLSSLVAVALELEAADLLAEALPELPPEMGVVTAEHWLEGPARTPLS